MPPRRSKRRQSKRSKRRSKRRSKNGRGKFRAGDLETNVRTEESGDGTTFGDLPSDVLNHIGPYARRERPIAPGPFSITWHKQKSLFLFQLKIPTSSSLSDYSRVKDVLKGKWQEVLISRNIRTGFAEPDVDIDRTRIWQVRMNLTDEVANISPDTFKEIVSTTMSWFHSRYDVSVSQSGFEDFTGLVTTYSNTYEVDVKWASMPPTVAISKALGTWPQEPITTVDGGDLNLERLTLNEGEQV